MTRKPVQSAADELESTAASARLPWFTADEIPQPPPEMRKPPQVQDEPTLFDLCESDSPKPSDQKDE